jgi:hypothetical protein
MGGGTKSTISIKGTTRHRRYGRYEKYGRYGRENVERGYKIRNSNIEIRNNI